jgi:hypothetical protein
MPERFPDLPVDPIAPVGTAGDKRTSGPTRVGPTLFETVVLLEDLVSACGPGDAISRYTGWASAIRITVRFEDVNAEFREFPTAEDRPQ